MTEISLQKTMTTKEYNKTTINNYTYNEEGTINVPFSWEYKPGIPKVTHEISNNYYYGIGMKLQPPPCSLSGIGSKSCHGFKMEETQIPDDLGLCAVQTLLRASSLKMESNIQKEEDPFVEAYKKCTKSPFIHQRSSKVQKTNNGSWLNIRKYMHIFSCKYSGDVISHKAAVCT